jgi:XTP/dITP diphosphohydrolase
MDPRLQEFERLLNIMDKLRAECPWDKAQTLETLRHLTIEETYELSDAIMKNDLQEVKKELGDLMLHLVFYSKIGEEKEAFTIKEVLQSINEKLIYRHPHIFSDVKVADAREVADNWEKLKLKEGKTSVLQGVPKSLPPLVKAFRIQEKVKGVGFDWDNREQVWEKVEEEKQEFLNEIIDGNLENAEMEFGDLLFALVNYARFVGINPENALEKTNQKFINRFTIMEGLIKNDGKDMHDMNLAQLDEYWNHVKSDEK